jgi:hypothetical protein|tara:strand:- start:3002 stop:3214 length:213 start_codon:yes stop_codon:yes gene_type:complete
MNDTDVDYFVTLLKEKISQLNNTIVQREKYNNDLREENVKLKKIIDQFEGLQTKKKSDTEVYAPDTNDSI